tara:strand:+ start:45204 stop:47897 length:2694 start_codon:yes stop_codon:yes gene_type:complete
MLEIPVEHLKPNYKELLDALIVPNPEYRNAQFFGMGKVKSSIPEKLSFFSINEADKTILVPRCVGTEFYDENAPMDFDVSEGKTIVDGSGGKFKYRPHQEKFMKGVVEPYIYNIINNNTNTKKDISILINAECGGGKCHGKGTEILMYDGTLKKVEDIKVGDLIMGDDSTPREVLSLANGFEELYKIKQRDGEDYVVNKSHILSVQVREWGAKSGNSRSRRAKASYGEVLNISVEDYLKLPKTRKKWLYGYSKPVKYRSKKIKIDPYFLGLWLGDGSSNKPSVTTDFRDTELIDTYYSIAESYSLGVRIEPNSNNSNVYHITGGVGNKTNLLLNGLRYYKLINNKHIPTEYLINSTSNRKKLLAGLIDSDGNLQSKSFSITQKSLRLAEDIKRLCWSLGYKVTHRPKIVNGVEYQRLTIKGNDLYTIPCKLDRKKAQPREINKDASISSFTVEPLGVGEYFGFTISGNHLYHLKDSTITHNTVLSLALANYYRVNTIVSVTNKKIGNQFINTVKDLFPNWSVGWQDEKSFKAEYDITVSTYSLLSKSRYKRGYFRQFGHIIMDEYHRCGADTYSKILEKADCRFRTSLTATFRRKDGLHKILRLHTGEIFEMERTAEKAIIFPVDTCTKLNDMEFRSPKRFPASIKKLKPYTDVAVRTKNEKPNYEVDKGMISAINKSLTEITLASGIGNGMKKYKVADHNIFKLGNISLPKIDTAIAEYENRNTIAYEIIKYCLSKGRKIIVLSKRKEQLFRLDTILGKRGVKTGLFVSESDKRFKNYCKNLGRTTKEQLNYVFKESQVILGIDKLAEEGMDTPDFDTIIYLHPVKDIEQSIGRILREHKNKKKPLGFYFLDDLPSYSKYFYGTDGAEKMYKELGHDVRSKMKVVDVIDVLKNEKL